MLLTKFGRPGCPPCEAMRRAKTLERFIEKHPDVRLILLDVADENDETPRGSIYETNNKLSDVFQVTSLPTLLFLTDDGGELVVLEGGQPMHELEKGYRDAVKIQEAGKRIAEAAVPKTNVAVPA